MSHDVLFVSLKEPVIPDEFVGIGHHLWYTEDVIDVSVSYAQLQVNKRNKISQLLHDPQVIQIHTTSKICKWPNLQYYSYVK